MWDMRAKLNQLPSRLEKYANKERHVS